MSKSRKARRGKKKQKPKPLPPAPPPSVTVRLIPREAIPIDEGLTWYAIETWPGWEDRVERTLTRHHITTYWPSDTFEHTIRGRAREYKRSTFPGYLFVGMPGKTWPSFTAMPGWIGPVAMVEEIGLEYVRIPVVIAAAILTRIERALIGSQDQAKYTPWHEGEEVRVIAPAMLAGLPGVISSVLNERIIEVTIKMFARSTSVRLGVDQVVLR